MNKRENLVGKKFGKVTVIKLSDKMKYKTFLWECNCECGNVCFDTTQNLKTGHRKSCGCSKTNLVGFRTGMLIVIEYIGTHSYDDNHSERRWKCLCDCGRYTELSTAILTKNKIKSCGCLHKLKGNKHKAWCGYEEISGSMWKQITNCAKVRNLEFSITIEYIWELFLKQNRKCKLTNLDIILSLGSLTTASLDRIDSTKGYIEGNVQWLHKDVNKMKSNFNEKYFIDICVKISKNLRRDNV